MTPKKKSKRQAQRLLLNLQQIASRSTPLDDDLDESGSGETVELTSLVGQAVQLVTDSSRLPRLKRFRFQLLHQWLVQNLEPCRVADIGGGKGLLSYLLVQSGWQATVIDPFQQPLPEKYKDILTGRRVKISPQAKVPYLQAEFEPHLAQAFDLLVGMHAHGCNVKIIDAAAETGCGFVLFPCCVIDEPFSPSAGMHWLESLADYAVKKNQVIHPFRLNFKGQNIGLFKAGSCRTKMLVASG
jgi:hypothetical protein